MRAALLQHADAVGAGRIGDWLEMRGIQASRHALQAGEAVPNLDSFDLLVVLGGPMSVHDEVRLPWMSEEKRLIHQALMAGKRIFGICLGAQLLAEALGARVHDGPAEIGWWPLEKHLAAESSPVGRMLPQRLMAMHWHRQHFDLPHAVVPLYGSASCANQGFVWKERAIGLQCHLESTPQSVEVLLEAYPEDLKLSGAVQDRASIRDGLPHCSALSPTLFRLLDYLSGPHASLT